MECSRVLTLSSSAVPPITEPRIGTLDWVAARCGAASAPAAPVRAGRGAPSAAGDGAPDGGRASSLAPSSSTSISFFAW